MSFSNYHTHTVFCDGADTPQALCAEAVRLGCPAIGFTGHAHTPFDESYCMSADGCAAYRAAVCDARAAYAPRLRVLLGVEQDYFSDTPTTGYDYVIGSVHYVQKNGEYLPVDDSCAALQAAVKKHYGGDWYALAEAYYALVGELYEKTRCSIVGHFDLVTKFNEGDALFSTAHPRYRRAATAALDRLLAAPVVFEVNTGAMARGYRLTPYPAKEWIDYIRRAGGRLLLTSDCHDKRQLLFRFEEISRILEVDTTLDL